MVGALKFKSKLPNNVLSSSWSFFCLMSTFNAPTDVFIRKYYIAKNKANKIFVAQNKLKGVVYIPIKCLLFYLEETQNICIWCCVNNIEYIHKLHAFFYLGMCVSLYL